MSARCRDCPADVFWVIINKGARMLVNTEPVLNGNLEIDLDADPPAATTVKPEKDVKRHISHFVDCPAATKHRKR